MQISSLKQISDSKQRFLFKFSGSLFFLSLVFIGFETSGLNYWSIFILFFGYMNGEITCWANPLWLTASFLMFESSRKYSNHVALLLLVLACFLSLRFIGINEIYDPISSGFTSGNQNTMRITGLGLGYWLWLSAIFTSLIGCIWIVYSSWKSEKKKKGESQGKRI